MWTLAQQPAPEHADLLALGDAVGGHEGAAHCTTRLDFDFGGIEKHVIHGRLALAETYVLEFLPARCGAFDDLTKRINLGRQIARRLDIPAGDKIEHAGAVNARRHGGHVGLLFCALVLFADKGRIAEDVI